MSRVSHATAAMATALVVFASLAAMPPSNEAFAVGGNDFDPGFIIADELFYDGDAMSVAEIQDFLNARIGNCNNGNCLNIYRQATQTKPASPRCPGGYAGKASESAAEIIFNVQRSCNISAKVILVTLQKEQGLVTSRGPSLGVLERSMGYYCPDDPTRPGWCNPEYGGFFNQVYNASAQFQRYRLQPELFDHRVRTQDVRYHPNAACGSQRVTIRNSATAGLYNYTPYVPNAAALANIGGVGDSCSAYGNRNFWAFYESWFGSTRGTPRPVPTSGIVGTSSDGAAWLYGGNGAGGFVPREPLPPELAGLTSLAAVGDLTGDGRPDLVAARNQREIVIAEGAADPRFASVRSLTTMPESVRFILGPGDLNASGARDLLVVGESGALYYLQNSGFGRMSAPQTVGSGWSAMRVVRAAGDLTGDGRSDVIAIRSDGALMLYEGRGGARWASGRQIGSGWGGMTSLMTGVDFSGNGRVDLVATDTTGRMWLYRGLGGARWAARTQIGAGWSTFQNLTLTTLQSSTPYISRPGVGDLNGDGTRDILAIFGSGEARAYFSDGRGAWSSSPRGIADWGQGDRFVGSSDFDGDGKSDLVRITGDGELLITNVEAPMAIGDSTRIGWGWSSMRAVTAGVDVNGDERPDIVAIDSSGNLLLYPGNGVGGFLPRQTLATGLEKHVDLIHAGAWDARGFPTLLSRTEDGRLWAMDVQVGGTVSAPRSIGQGWQSFSLLFSPGDFDGDGHNDILARDDAGRLWLYPGSGKGGFLPARAVGTGWNVVSWIG